VKAVATSAFAKALRIYYDLQNMEGKRGGGGGAKCVWEGGHVCNKKGVVESVCPSSCEGSCDQRVRKSAPHLLRRHG
jgi:hypothetical protein